MTRTYPIIKMTIAGIEYVWQDTDIVTARAVQEVHPISLELPASTIDFTVYTTDPQFSIFSDGDLYEQLAEGQVIQVFEYVDGINVFINEFYLKEWEYTSANTLRFRGIDLIGRLDGMPYDGAFWSSYTSVSVILGAILDPLGIPFVVNSATSLKGWIPPGTAREALQRVCAAARLIVGATINETLVINPAIYQLHVSSIDLTVPDTDKQDNQTVELLPKITGVDLITHDYSQGATSETIFSETLEPGSYKIVFNKPYYSITATGAGYIPDNLITEGGDTLITEGGDYLIANGDYQYGPNSIYLTVFPPGGAVVITGYPWVDNKQSFNPSTGENINNLVVEDATLVNFANRYPVHYHLSDYYDRRYVHRFTLLHYNTPTALYGFAPVYGSGTYSAAGLKVGDVVLSNVLSKAVLGVAEKLEYDLSGGFRINVESVGIEWPAIT